MTITEKIEELEKQITEHKKELVNLRAQDSTKGINNYKFQTHDGGNIQLSELFGDNSSCLSIWERNAFTALSGQTVITGFSII